jgi:putative transcriptional regulator
MEHVEDELLAYVLGTCDGAGRARVEAHLRGCAGCAKQLLEVERVGSALTTSVAADGLWTKIAGDVEGGKRFAHLAEPVAKFFDISLEQARALLMSIDDKDGWFEGPGEGNWVKPVEAGPKLSNAISTLIRVSPGFVVPEHQHAGREQMFVLEGGFSEANGEESWRGDICTREAGSTHEPKALPGMHCIAAVVLDQG